MTKANRLLTIWGPTKVVHFNHAVLAGLLDMPPSQIRMIELENGGGYGIRGEFYPEDFLIPFIARQLCDGPYAGLRIATSISNRPIIRANSGTASGWVRTRMAASSRSMTCSSM